MNETDIHFMQLAITEAKRGVYTTAPNPNVGCIIVKDKRILASGFHHHSGGAHAEIDALSKLTHAEIEGSEIYITLEPCSHFGKTPPCVDALIKAKPKRVIIACEDPFPLVSGRGISALKSAGITVTLGVCEAEALELNRGFIKRVKHGKPWVTLKIASSLDGKTALNNMQSKWITGNVARTDAHYLRASSCAIITGSGTVLHDDPSMTVRDIDIVKNPWRIVIDGKLQTTTTAKIYQTHSNDSDNTRRIIATTIKSPDSIAKFTEAGIIVWNDITHPTTKKINLNALLTRLGDQGCNYVMIEAGPSLSGAYLAENLVDEIVLYMAPCLIGNIAKSMFILPEINDLINKDIWQFIDVKNVGTDIKITLRKPANYV